ncbi:helix-turn-helix domain-containing protein [Ramlibacter sp. USB13]|uniref:Helix-turn-helix domain-containing protein n=1 Tax=Ramlibacter cellulosilyticus TaxID=2764187 RepID=A0A923MUP7_9BURK|nr:helix-turn-helix domain-containing protein [Ramlibacter cellulosilyticus]MBC5785073.1 helix-turn-helix domain-containing protein [Ramlibacter cellulosilyticus]
MDYPLLTTMQLGHVLQSARKLRGLTQAEMGERLALSQKRISALERNPGSITVEQLLGLCSALGLELTIAPRTTPPMAAKGARAPRSKVEW